MPLLSPAGMTLRTSKNLRRSLPWLGLWLRRRPRHRLHLLLLLRARLSLLLILQILLLYLLLLLHRLVPLHLLLLYLRIRLTWPLPDQPLRLLLLAARSSPHRPHRPRHDDRRRLLQKTPAKTLPEQTPSE